MKKFCFKFVTRSFAAGLLAVAGVAGAQAQVLKDYSLCNEFTFNLFQEVARQHDDNIAMSPLSLETALAMLQAGANGNTHNELKEAIGMGHMTKTEINEYFKGMLDQLMRDLDLPYSPFLGGSNYLGLNMANSIWIDQSSSIRPGFSMDCQNWYNANVHSVDLRSGAANDEIDYWVKQQLGDGMPSVGPNPDENLSMLLLNAMRFYGEWDDWFYQKDIKDDVFTNYDGSRVMVPTMYKDRQCNLAMTDNFDMLELIILPVVHVKTRFSMFFYLPQNDDAVLTEEEHTQLHKNKKTEWTNLYLPQFTIDDNHSLLEPLENLGVHGAFSPTDADFTGIMERSQENLHLSSIVQPCHLEVDRRGVRAQSVTRVGGVGYLPQEGVVTLRFNRPFYFTIEDNEANVVLFIGRVNHLDGPAADPGIDVPSSVERIDLNTDHPTAEGSYDLAGRKLNGDANHRGVVIENGRKVIR